MKSKFLLLFSVLFLLFSCRNNAQNENRNNRNTQENASRKANENTDYQRNTSVPKKVYDVLKYVRANGEAMQGYVGGRTFQNREKRLTINDEKGKKIRYQEWDVNSKERGRNRGAERLITSDKKAFYTNDHYKTFQEIE